MQNKKISPASLLKNIRAHLDSKRKKDIKFVFFLSILSSLAESISIALLVPFVSFFVNPDNYLFNDLFKSFFNFFNLSSEKDVLTTVSLSFIFIVMLSGLIKLKYIKSSNALTDNITSDFRIKVFNFLINQDYSYYFKFGSNEIMSNLSQKTGSFTTIIFSSINIVNSILISSAIMIVLIINEPFYTPIIILTIILFFFIVFKIKSKSVLKKGQTVSSNQNSIIDVFQNTVGYLPEIIVYDIRKFFSAILSKSSTETASATSEVRTISASPRIYLESFVIILIILIIYFSDFNERSIEANISYLAILAFGTQKCLPLINNVYNLSINFKNATPIVDSFLQILDRGNEIKFEEKKITPLNFSQSIKLENISFQYNKDIPKILNNFSLEIKKGDKIAIKGQTGSGKTTLANIIAGLLYPSEGKIWVDNKLIDSENLKSWQKNVAIVPQTVFLTDNTILENIAIALDKNNINVEKVKNSAKLAQIDNFIVTLPNKYNEKVGERGVRLSGGQRQRLGIARALYRDTNVIILDEPTNALDSKTEKLVMDSITKLSKNITLIMISHNNTTTENFDKIIDLDKFR